MKGAKVPIPTRSLKLRGRWGGVIRDLKSPNLDSPYRAVDLSIVRDGDVCSCMRAYPYLLRCEIHPLFLNQCPILDSTLPFKCNLSSLSLFFFLSFIIIEASPLSSDDFLTFFASKDRYRIVF